jgi:hypothetical protein
MCGRGGEQYAHIVPESDGGAYELDNLIFLCYPCHNTWQEPARSPAEIKSRLIEVSRNLRDKDKTDNVLTSVFGWTAGDLLSVTLGGGIRFANHDRILERRDDETRPYLRLHKDELGLLHINAYFDDANGKDFMHIEDNVLKVHTAEVWDVIINRRRIRFAHVDRKMRLEITQAPDLSLHVTGNLYLNGGYYEIMDARIYDAKYGISLSGNHTANGERGLLLSSGEFGF